MMVSNVTFTDSCTVLIDHYVAWRAYIEETHSEFHFIVRISAHDGLPQQHDDLELLARKRQPELVRYVLGLNVNRRGINSLLVAG